MKNTYFWAAVLLVVLLASACQPAIVIPVTGGATSTPVNFAIFIEEQPTISALETRLALIPSAPPTVASTPSLPPTRTPIPPPAVMPTLIPSTQTPSLVPTAASNGCNQAEFVADMTIPDGTTFAPGQKFVKTWRVRNIGTCTWTRTYRITSLSGNPLGGPDYSILGISIAPGRTIDLSLALTAPMAAGTYKTLYLLEDDQGNRFGIGTGDDSSIDVSIVVLSPTATLPLAVTHVDLSVNTQVVSAKCPPGYPFSFSATIFANGPGNISYHWIFSNGTTTGQQTINFSAAGSQTVSTIWTLGAGGTLPTNPYTGTASLYIDDPNHQAFGSQPVAIGCTFPTP